VVVLNLLAKAYLEEDPMRSESYASQALFISESIEDLQGKSEAHYHLALLAMNDRDYNKSFANLSIAITGFTALEDEKWLAKSYLIKSDELKQNLEYEQALQLLFQARDIFTKLNKEKKLAETYNRIGGCYYDQGNFEKAYEFFQNGLNLYSKTGSQRGLSVLYNNIGEIYRINKNYALALDYYHKAIEINLKLNHSDYLAINYDNIGSIYIDKNNLDSASYYLSRALELGLLSEDPKIISSIRVSLGSLHLIKGDHENALKNLQQGYDIAVQNSYLLTIRDASLRLSQVHKELQDHKKAYQFFRQYRTTNDSIHNIENLEKITRMGMKYLYDQESEINKIQNQRVNLKYFSIAAGLISLSVILVLLYGRLRLKNLQNRIQAENLQLERSQLQDELDYKNRELTTNVMYLVKKNELINYISEKLLKAKPNFTVANKKSIQEVILNLQSNVDENVWLTFEERFKEVHKDFYKNLNEQFPNLSENDKKLCAFIKLDMNTKEIAAITHQNPSSIEVARTRLRKKLNISNTDISLNSFLAKI